jgi:hypothetical protein
LARSSAVLSSNSTSTILILSQVGLEFEKEEENRIESSATTTKPPLVVALIAYRFHLVCILWLLSILYERRMKRKKERKKVKVKRKKIKSPLQKLKKKKYNLNCI